MKDKEWSKFGKDVMSFANKLRDQGLTKDQRAVVVVAGYPGEKKLRTHI
jgi:hypothetical protein